jgi:hypothetical protein
VRQTRGQGSTGLTNTSPVTILYPARAFDDEMAPARCSFLAP